MSYTTIRRQELGRPSARHARPALAAAAVYVGAWAVGLPLAPGAPSWTDAQAVHDFYLEHAAPVLAQALLVHGVAGIAMAVFAVRLNAVSVARGERRNLVAVTGCSAAMVSLAQTCLALVVTRDPGQSSAAATADLLHLINLADTVKLVLLAAFVASAISALTASQRVPAWLRAISWSLVVLLPAGAAAFVIDSGLLTALLTVSLPLLLVWVAAVGSLARADVG
jgi:hypothetical protein